ncbi:MAG: AAA family ATPase [Gammaproteobacteria bacterium]|nr:AAA family ATPase [Gammaproteobacteria bacterium]
MIPNTCSACGFESPAGLKFCGQCGQTLGLSCPKCHAAVPGGFKFCGECGASIEVTASGSGALAAAERSPRAYTPKHLADKILQSKSALEGERKQVTVLFADVKGSMELAEQLDPEQWHSILEGFFEILTEGVHRFEGTVNQYTGDGIMALFGAPIAHEDHAQRACYAALDLRDSLRSYANELRRNEGLNLSTRIGINSGEVVVGKIGDDLRMDYTAQGHTVGLAQRMENLAEPNTCYLSEATARLVTGFCAFDDLGPFRVRGVSEPVGVFVLRGVGEQRTRFDVARQRGLSQFVGRDGDMQALESALSQAQAGNGQVVGLVAPAGTGKSRICFEFLEQCRARGCAVTVGHAVAHGKNVPFLPMLEAFRDYYDVKDGDADHVVREKIAKCLLRVDANLAEMLPVVFEFFGVPDPARPVSRTLDAEARQRQLFEVLRREVREGSDGGQLVTLIEDLHWIDAGSEAFLEQWVDAIAGSRALLLLNFRPEYHARWMGKSYYRQIPLAPLDPEAMNALLGDLLGDDASIAGLAEVIYERTGGNPFFTEEVVQSLIESGALAGARGQYRMMTPITQLQVPPTVHAVLAARMDRLAEPEKRLLQTAAVIGKNFSEPVLVQVLADVAPQEAAPDEVAAALHVLAQAEFIYEQTLYPVAEYTFKHPLTQQVAYETLLRERRAQVHAAVAVASAEVFADKLDEKAGLLAHHWEQAGDRWQAALWHERAANWAGLTDSPEMLRHWQLVLSCLRPLPHSAETLALGVKACVASLNLAWRLGTPTAKATELFEEGRRLAEAAGDVVSLAALHGTYGCVLGLVGGDADEYVHYSREAVRLADQTEDTGLQVAEHAFLGYGCALAGRLTEGIEVCESARARFPPDAALGVEYTGGYSPFIGILNSHAWVLARAGRLDEASTICQQGEDMARAHGDYEVGTWLQLARIEADVCRADTGAARDHARSAVETGAKATTDQSRFVGLLTPGISHRLDRDWDKSEAVLEEAVLAIALGYNRMFEGWVRAELARTLLGRGEVDRAEREAQTAITIAHAQHCRYDEARANLVLVHIELRRGDAAALVRAEEALASAQALIDETGARAHQPEVHECRAAMAQLRGDSAAARSENEAAQRLYTEMGATTQAQRLALAKTV